MRIHIIFVRQVARKIGRRKRLQLRIVEGFNSIRMSVRHLFGAVHRNLFELYVSSLRYLNSLNFLDVVFILKGFWQEAFPFAILV